MTLKACVLHARNDLRIDTIKAPQLTAGSARIAMSFGGICGSDLHYFHHGGFGPVRVKEPIILGHEISGVVMELAEDVTSLAIGDRVAVSPSQPCFDCAFCQRKEWQHCTNMRFLGSARTMPHVQGGFRSQMVIGAGQCHKISTHTSLQAAACAEPLAVCLHAAAQVGDLAGKRVLVTGAGPIGALCCAVASLRGTAHITVTDLFDFTLDRACQMGATIGINTRTHPDALKEHATAHGPFDVVFECTAAEPAILGAIDVIRPRGTIVQVGVAGNLSLPINAIVGKEIRFQGTHRFHPEFAEAVALIDSGAVNVAPMVTQTYPVEQAVEAFGAASNRDTAVKVQIRFDPSAE